MLKLLDVAGWLCGPSARARFVEPFVADWQRELAEAKTPVARISVWMRGFSPFARCVVNCLFSDGVAMRTGVTMGTLTVVLIISTLVLLGTQMALSLSAIKGSIPIEMRFWLAVPPVARLAVPMTMLPFMMLARDRARLTRFGAAAALGLGAVLAYLSAGWLMPSLQGDVRDELHEAIYQQEIANEQAGRFTYPWSAARQARQTTPEQRAADRARWRRSRPYLENQAELTKPNWGRESLEVAALSIAMGLLGWQLGGIARTRPRRAAVWWLVTLITLIADGHFLYPGNAIVQIIGRWPSSLATEIFMLAALLVLTLGKQKQEEANYTPPDHSTLGLQK